MFNFSQTALASTLVLSIGFAGSASAALYDRGGGLLYDDRLNVTWLQDANYARTTVYNGNIYGNMTWNQAQTWAENLVYHDDVRNIDYSDWRLPSMFDSGTLGCNASNNGTDCGQNVDTSTSELAYMFHVNLDLKSILSATGGYQADYGIFGNGHIGGQFDVGLVHNLQSSAYWFGNEYAPISDGYAWVFYTNYGSQYYLQKYSAGTGAYGDGTFAWAVRDGDVAVVTVPEPSIIWLFLSGFGLLVVDRARKVSRSAD
ncbi:hypothetical protein CWO84_10605 [Methylomonas sp. Kb3]|uniref:PEP-CTERM sorting domain-containing protein n=1 Tax=Methylomonas sp. Kb3 TaxID=1611544 RepID=UPI000C3425B5|nr:PEP-CTERM sorting domain-containing protein [Methylomonas sp. Kb3]PKD40433.1 hypothetical protein CWO84_10605 [Methylomonas sp. Kb3]